MRSYNITATLGIPSWKNDMQLWSIETWIGNFITTAYCIKRFLVVKSHRRRLGTRLVIGFETFIAPHGYIRVRQYSNLSCKFILARANKLSISWKPVFYWRAVKHTVYSTSEICSSFSRLWIEFTPIPFLSQRLFPELASLSSNASKLISKTFQRFGEANEKRAQCSRPSPKPIKFRGFGLFFCSQFT